MGENAEKRGLAMREVGALVDYVSFTFRAGEVGDVVGWLSAVAPSLLPGRGMHGYREGLCGEGFRVLFSGRADMGVHVQISGSGCRAIAECGRWASWGAFFADMRVRGGVETRVDLAWDWVGEGVKRAEVEAAVADGLVRTRFRRVRVVREQSDGAERGFGVYWGAPTSEVQVVVYDKALEQAARGRGAVGPWLRFEARYRGAEAVAMGAWIVSNEELVGGGGFLAGLVSFMVPSTDGGGSASVVAPWWEEFLRGAEKVRAGVARVGRTLEQLADVWMRSQGPTLALLVAGLCGEAGSMKWLKECISAGWQRLNARQEGLLTAHAGRVVLSWLPAGGWGKG